MQTATQPAPQSAILDDEPLTELDVQLVHTANQKLDVKSPPSHVNPTRPDSNILDYIRLTTLTAKLNAPFFKHT